MNPKTEHIGYTDDGYLDEIWTACGAHMEAMGDDHDGTTWWLQFTRADGSSINIYMTGRVHTVEEWPAESPNHNRARRAGE